MMQYYTARYYTMLCDVMIYWPGHLALTPEHGSAATTLQKRLQQDPGAVDLCSSDASFWHWNQEYPQLEIPLLAISEKKLQLCPRHPWAKLGWPGGLAKPHRSHVASLGTAGSS